jgi:PAS domain S-box-containing protein
MNAAAALLANTRDLILVLDEGGRIEYANDAVERVLGYEPSAVVGDDVVGFVAEADREAVSDAFIDVTRGPADATTTIEHRGLTADGETTWLESRMANHVDDDVGGYVVSARDVSDRKRAERHIQETESRLRRLAANAGDVLWMFTADWAELLFVNDAYEEMYGRSKARLDAEPSDFLNAVYPAHRERVAEAMARLSAGESVDIEYRVNATEDFRRWVWVQADPIVEAGVVRQVAGFSRDVTQRRERERQLQAMDRVLRHNLRNDMNLVLGHATEANALVDDSRATTHLERAIQNGEKLLATATKGRHVVELLGPEAGGERLDLPDVVESAVTAVRGQYPGATISVARSASAAVSTVDKLPLAVEELLENAVVHGEGPVTVRVAEADSWVDLEVRNAGPPIPDDELSILDGGAEPRPLKHGSGLGLRLVSWVGRCSGGSLSFSREDGENCVTLRLPRATT